MNRSRILTVGIFGALMLSLGSAALAQTMAALQPSPPPQVCVNGKCATTPVPAAAASGTIKWNPGHYMASYGVVYGGNSTSFIQTETNDLNNQDAMIGYRMAITWSSIETSQGNYDFSAIDSTLQMLKTAYNKPKHLVVMLWLYNPSSHGNNDTKVIPAYIQQNPTYGNSPVSGSYGWWGKSSNGQSTGMYAPKLYTQPVMDRLIALVQALGQHLDGDPNFEALFIQEDASFAQAAVGFQPGDPNYSDGAWLTQLQRLLSASTAAFPHTNVIMANSYFQGPSATVTLEQWMASNRIAAGSADTLGQTGINSQGVGMLSWGIQSYMGIAQYGGVDLRPKMAIMMDIEEPDLASAYFNKYGGPWSPADMINALNSTYHATHAFWTRLTGTQGPTAALWPNLAATCAANPLTRTAYPANYQ
jgi:hypothetical protein